ncbi:tetratricopeptide repeat protein 8 isoform X2 [Wyeomyia smithii]|uniref:tetratricopeptide repeat protein 8 isoform X2 n=1 Tax=Wyeomyia smithii TaxID=174621 RepID=UPI002467B725|nr:tetratricopeptide repeat protein 8 isoform X2 [Wyeomyia smithii]
MDKFFAAVSLFRRRKYDECIEVCNELLQNNALHQGPWELKMRSMTQRVYIDDIEADDDVPEDILDTQTIATAPRPGTSIRTAALNNSTITGKASAAGTRPRTGTGRPITGISRPGTLSLQRPGSTLGNKTALKTSRTAGSARNIRLGSASMFAVGDPTGPLFHISRLHPEKYAEKEHLSKPLFQYLYYHEGDIRKAMGLCDAVLKLKQSAAGWWWNTQKARCLITTGSPREAEQYLNTALAEIYHQDTVLLLARIYIKIDQPTAALEVCKTALEKLPNDVTILTQQARILELVGNLTASVRRYRQISQLDSMNTEALACIAVSYFYGNQPETALLYYRRILSMGAHSAELYCNIGLCCLYGGQLDLVFPCFQRAIRMATSPELKADIWYNLSFVALTTGDVHLARRCLRLCIATNGSHGPALNNMAVMVAHQKQYAKAKSYLVSAKVALPTSEEISANLEFIENFE